MAARKKKEEDKYNKAKMIHARSSEVEAWEKAAEICDLSFAEWARRSLNYWAAQAPHQTASTAPTRFMIGADRLK